MQTQLKVKSVKNRLPLSVMLSLVAHLLVFYSIGLLLQFHPPKPPETKMEVLQVKLALPQPAPPHPESGKRLLTSKSPAQFKVTQTNAKTPLKEAPNIPAAAAKQAPPATKEVAGIAFPGAITTPWQGQARLNISPFQARQPQQDLAQMQYQQAMEAQARQRAASQAQIIILQLQQTLVKQLDVQPRVSGNCKLEENPGGVNNRLKCDSGALYEVISGEQNNITEMLMTLRGLGQTFSGFSAEINADKPSVELIIEK